mmetsp:Transcript_8449/g.28928  ORF Transcript_8449/g.28928 Transcript_8449/m.28928 type:complete len:227 (+) Transcript_8449:1760-2440(+)
MAGASAVRAAAQARRAASAAPSAERPVSLSTGGASLAAKARTKSRPWRPFGPSGVVGTAREAPNPPGVTPRVRGSGADRRSGRAVRAQGATPVTVVGGGAPLVGTQSRAARAPCTAAATFCAFDPGAAAEQAAPLSCSGSETSAAAAAKAPLSSDSRRSSTSTVIRFTVGFQCGLPLRRSAGRRTLISECARPVARAQNSSRRQTWRPFSTRRQFSDLTHAARRSM